MKGIVHEHGAPYRHQRSLSLITSLDESILPALIDGEERILSYYDHALQTFPSSTRARQDVLAQRVS
jgi:hypothetical protein